MPHALSHTEHSTSLLHLPLSPTRPQARAKAPQSHSHSHRPQQAKQHMLPLLNMEASPPQSSSKQQQLMRTVSISVLVMSLPVLYVSFLHVPPAALFRDTTFWFLMSNSIIIVIAADSGMLFFGSSSSSPAAADDDGSGVPFVVSGSHGGESEVAVKSGHASSMGGVSVGVSDEVVVEDQAALVVMEHGDLLPVIAGDDDGHAHALVVREDRVVETTPESREIIVSPSAGGGEVVAVKDIDGGAIVPAARPRSSRMTANRSLAAREERPAAATRTRRRHGHRPSQSHSHALVPVQDKSVVVVSEEKPHHLRRTATDRRRPSPPPPPPVVEESEYSRLLDEELNRRVEEFITKFNREIRLQVEKEQAAVA